jgi:hypothetical protein
VNNGPDSARPQKKGKNLLGWDRPSQLAWLSSCIFNI